MFALRPHVEPRELALWSSVAVVWQRMARRCLTRCEKVIDTMFGFELRPEERNELMRRKR